MVGNRVFVDSSVLLAAVFSPTGGSRHLLTNFGSQFSFYINRHVLDELSRIISDKFGGDKNVSEKLFLIMGAAGINVLSNPSYSSIRTVSRVINADDAPILSSAIENCDCLLTLDNDFFLHKALEYANKHKLAILKPGQLLDIVRGN